MNHDNSQNTYWMHTNKHTYTQRDLLFPHPLCRKWTRLGDHASPKCRLHYNKKPKRARSANTQRIRKWLINSKQQGRNLTLWQTNRKQKTKTRVGTVATSREDALAFADLLARLQTSLTNNTKQVETQLLANEKTKQENKDRNKAKLTDHDGVATVVASRLSSALRLCVWAMKLFGSFGLFGFCLVFVCTGWSWIIFIPLLVKINLMPSNHAITEPNNNKPQINTRWVLCWASFLALFVFVVCLPPESSSRSSAVCLPTNEKHFSKGTLSAPCAV